MNSQDSKRPLFILEKLHGLAILCGGLLVLALVVVGFAHGEMFSTWGSVHWREHPALFLFGALVLSVAGFYLMRRGYLILAQRSPTDSSNEG